MSNTNASKIKLVGAVTLTSALGFGLGMMAAHHKTTPTSANSQPDTSAKSTTTNSTATPALTVTVSKPIFSNAPTVLSANGNVAAWQEASIGSEVNGLRITDVRVNVGDWVTKGQVLATFAQAAVDADLAQSRASLAEAEATLAEAHLNAKRYQSLQSTGAVSEQQITQYITAEKTAAARVSMLKASLASQQVRVQNATVVAPDSGMISARSATVGAVANAGSELFHLIRQGRLEWRAEVTAEELGRIKTGMHVQVIAPNNVTLVGTVRTLSPTINPQTRAALVYVDLPTSGTRGTGISAGMFAKGLFDLGAANVITLPQQAVVVRDGFSYVFKLNPDQHVEQLKVTTGRHLADSIEILDGLTADSQVVVKGAGFLNDGDLVRVAPVTAVPTASITNVSKE